VQCLSNLAPFGSFFLGNHHMYIYIYIITTCIYEYMDIYIYMDVYLCIYISKMRKAI
jgi:hypothetical protein